ncbi:MAG: hypothetical protein IIA00_06550 [Proteobacteria bacterium]|nr:hypothetical protein [Pseudomonadota bacterium]
MADHTSKSDERDLPRGKKWGKYARGALQAAGVVPFAGGLFSAAAGRWSEHEQERVNEFLRGWLHMLRDELREKQRTMAEIVTRLDMHDERIAARVRSDEYQSLLKKAFRNWAGTESAKKQEFIRNILNNAAATDLTSDDVVSLFIDWLHTYSEFHFAVIADIYTNPGATREEIWRRLGKGSPREDSAEADLYKLLFRDLSTGGVIRQHRETDYAGNFITRQQPKGSRRRTSGREMTSAFDDEKQYELTALGQQFVHYAMQELTSKIEYHADVEMEKDDEDGR